MTVFIADKNSFQVLRAHVLCAYVQDIQNLHIAYVQIRIKTFLIGCTKITPTTEKALYVQ